MNLIYVLLREGLLHLGNQGFERLGVVHGQVSQDLTVEGDAFLVEEVDELRVGQALFTHGGVDTGDPQAAVFALLEFAAYIGVGHTFLYNVFGNGVDILALAIETFGLLEDLFAACFGSNGIYGTRHILKSLKFEEWG